MLVGVVSTMDEKFDPVSAELKLTDEEIEARLAAAIWVNEKRAFVLRYLEDKKLKQKRAARSSELEIARGAKTVAWEAISVAKLAQRSAKLAFTFASIATAVAIAAAAIAAAIFYLKH
jgi:type IV secretory pathway component VirB8